MYRCIGVSQHFFFFMKCRLKVKEDVIAELHGNVIKKDEEIASLKSLLDEQKNKNNVSKKLCSRCIVNPQIVTIFGQSFSAEQITKLIKGSVTKS